MTVHYNLGKEYTDYLGGRLVKDGAYSGEAFRETVLLKLWEANQDAEFFFDLDALGGYTSSFFDESFCELVRRYGERAAKRLHFTSTRRPYLVEQIKQWMQEALTQYQASPPRSLKR